MGLHFSKLDAARRQLETAIVLYFHEGDPVSIHTLTAAAHQLLSDISEKREPGTQMLMAWVIEQVRPEFRTEIQQKIRAAQNFFKHADRDSGEVLTDFDQEQSELLLIDACWAYRRLTHERLPLLAVFEMWSTLTWAKSWLQYTTPEQFTEAVPPSTQERWARMTRQEYFGMALPAAHAAGSGAGSVLPTP